MSGGATPLLQPENDTARASTSATERIRAGFSEPPLCPPTHGGSAEGRDRKPASAAPRSFRFHSGPSLRASGSHGAPERARFLRWLRRLPGCG